MCLGCGQRSPQGDLLRLCATPTGLAVVTGCARTGRSGYLHRRAACWDAFATRKGPVRSLRQTVDKPERAKLVEALKRGERIVD